MPITTCANCGGSYAWRWEEAFDKFGFSDGDGQVMTQEVINALQTAGYEATAERCGCHNITIRSIERDGTEQIPETANVGYDDPRTYLPKDIVRLLDKALPTDREALA